MGKQSYVQIRSPLAARVRCHFKKKRIHACTRRDLKPHVLKKEESSAWFWKRNFSRGSRGNLTCCRRWWSPFCVLGVTPRDHTLDSMGRQADLDSGVEVAVQEWVHLERLLGYQQTGTTLHLDKLAGDLHGQSRGGWVFLCGGWVESCQPWCWCWWRRNY